MKTNRTPLLLTVCTMGSGRMNCETANTYDWNDIKIFLNTETFSYYDLFREMS